MLVYIILSVWTWSMLQFPLHLSGQSLFAYYENRVKLKMLMFVQRPLVMHELIQV